MLCILGSMDNAVLWTCDEVADWLEENDFGPYKKLLCEEHRLDGKALLTLTENDFRRPPLQIAVLGDIKRLMLCINRLQSLNPTFCKNYSRTEDLPVVNLINTDSPHTCKKKSPFPRNASFDSMESGLGDDDPSVSSENGSDVPLNTRHIESEKWKTFLSYVYMTIAVIIDSFLVVVVHNRTPDRDRYPPLPDLFLDNIPYMSWGFQVTEIIILTMGIILLIIAILHKHRHVVFRRYFVLMGTIFLLRCIAMPITTLSVPSKHMQCEKKMIGDAGAQIKRTMDIWLGLGLSMKGIRTCGDFMFSGHTVVLTLLNFFMTEYTPIKYRLYINIVTWTGNFVGMFFILASHAHYSIDVFVAFYITSRLFVYYHVLANNRSLRIRDKKRWKVWFPILNYFESKCDGIIPNEYEWPFPSFSKLLRMVRKLFRKARKIDYVQLKESQP